MPVFEYNLKKLKKELQTEENEKIAEIIESFKPEVEEITEDKIKISITQDRVDLFFEEGLLKAIKDFLFGGCIKKLEMENSGIKVYYKHKVRCREFFSCFVVKDLKMDENLLKRIIEFQETLHKYVGRDRSLVAIGIHDLDKIKGEIYYREALPNEKMIPLTYETEMTLNEVLEICDKGKKYGNLIYEPYPAIYDEESIISFPPIINSEKTRLTTNTKNIFVDITGIDKRSVEIATKILIYFFSFFGSPQKVYLNNDEYPKIDNEIIRINKKEINSLLGLNLKAEEIKNLLEKMGFEAITLNEEDIDVVVPFYRVDILHKRDIIEDVAIAYGYNNFELDELKTVTIGKIHEREIFENKIREFLIGMKFLEIITPTLTNKKNLIRAKISEEPTKILNPVSEEYNVIRNCLFPSILSFLSKNISKEYPQNVFEIGYIVKNLEDYRCLCICCCHEKANLSEIISILEELFKYLKKEISLKESKLEFLIEGRQAYIVLENKKVIGFLGEVHPEILSNFEIFMPTTIAEINLNLLI
ncbi:MAG: phenylalanine--tRNA ligase subunit beta [Candidatus Aenigmatarchaeota archaeon]